MKTLSELLVQVKELDANATKGPWVTSIQHGQANIGNPYLGKTLMIPTSAGDPIQDCLLVSKYREAAPLLAEIVEKLIEQREKYRDWILNVSNLHEILEGSDNDELDAIVAKGMGEK